MRIIYNSLSVLLEQKIKSQSAFNRMADMPSSFLFLQVMFNALRVE